MAAPDNLNGVYPDPPTGKADQSGEAELSGRASGPVEWRGDKSELVTGVAIVSHLAALLRDKSSDALPWIREELEAGRLKTEGGTQPSVLEEDEGGHLQLRAGKAPAIEEVLLESGLQITEIEAGSCEGEMTKRISETAEREGRRFLVVLELRGLTEADRLKQAVAELRRRKIMAVLIYVLVWLVVSLHAMTSYDLSPWVFVIVGVVSAFFLYFQVAEAVNVSTEADLFGRLRVILASLSGVFASFIIFISATPALDDPPRIVIIELLLLGLFISFATFALNPRFTELSTLVWVNELMRVSIAIGVSIIAAAIYVATFRFLGKRP